MTAKANPASPLDAIDPEKALVPAVQRLNEMRVRKGFWPKLVRTAARIPFADNLLSVYFAARDPETPAAAKGLMLGALAYWVLPIDLIPDVLVGIGFTDDAAVIAAVVATLSAHIRPRHHDAARETLKGLAERE